MARTFHPAGTGDGMSDDLYMLLVTRGYAQHEARRIAYGPPYLDGSSPEPGDCKDCDKLMTERDDATEQADKLADCIEGLLGIDIGEHSSGNAPWQNAIDAAEYELDKRQRAAPTKDGKP